MTKEDKEHKRKMGKGLEQKDFHKKYSYDLYTPESMFIFINRKVQINSTIKYHYLPTTMAKILKLTISGFGKEQ